MITFTFRPRGANMRADWSAFQRRMGEITKGVLMQEACLTARAALKYAPPLVATGGKGDTAAAGKMGERAIDKDVRAIFAPRESTLQAVFSQGRAGSKSAFTKWKSGTPPNSGSRLINKIYEDSDIERAYRKALNLYGDGKSKSKSLNNAGQMRMIHEGQRKNGRVVREGRPSSEIKRYPYVVKDALIKRYIKTRALQIGKLKSGWWEIISTYGRNLVVFGRAVDAGAKGLPKYITRHKGNGTLTKHFSQNAPSQRIIIRNQIGDNDGAGLRTKTFALVIAHRNAAIAKRPYQVFADKLVREWNRGGRK